MKSGSWYAGATGACPGCSGSVRTPHDQRDTSGGSAASGDAVASGVPRGAGFSPVPVGGSDAGPTHAADGHTRASKRAAGWRPGRSRAIPREGVWDCTPVSAACRGRCKSCCAPSARPNMLRHTCASAHAAPHLCVRRILRHGCASAAHTVPAHDFARQPGRGAATTATQDSLDGQSAWLPACGRRGPVACTTASAGGTAGRHSRRIPTQLCNSTVSHDFLATTASPALWRPAQAAPVHRRCCERADLQQLAHRPSGRIARGRCGQVSPLHVHLAASTSRGDGRMDGHHHATGPADTAWQLVARSRAAGIYKAKVVALPHHPAASAGCCRGVYNGAGARRIVSIETCTTQLTEPSAPARTHLQQLHIVVLERQRGPVSARVAQVDLQQPRHSDTRPMNARQRLPSHMHGRDTVAPKAPNNQPSAAGAPTARRVPRVRPNSAQGGEAQPPRTSAPQTASRNRAAHLHSGLIQKLEEVFLHVACSRGRIAITIRMSKCPLLNLSGCSETCEDNNSGRACPHLSGVQCESGPHRTRRGQPPRPE